jgi:hypothetical protein
LTRRTAGVSVSSNRPANTWLGLERSSMVDCGKLAVNVWQYHFCDSAGLGANNNDGCG